MLFPAVDQEFLGCCCKPLRRESDPPSVFLYRDVYVIKYGPHVHPGEIDAMDLLSSQGLPVPRVLHHGCDPVTGWFYFYTRREQGDVLGEIWEDLSGPERANVASQLHHIVAAMRFNKSDYIGSLGRLPCNDNFFAAPVLQGTGKRVQMTRRWYGPFRQHGAFTHSIAEYLTAHGFYDEQTPGIVCMLESVLRMSHVGDEEFVFTHGEIAAENVLVRDGRVVAVLDWNQAGYYPYYWEYVKASLVEPWSCLQRDGVIPGITKRHDAELSVMKHAHNVIWM